jgi:hypothetical protein
MGLWLCAAEHWLTKFKLTTVLAVVKACCTTQEAATQRLRDMHQTLAILLY